MSQIEAQIMGQSYTLRCPEDSQKQLLHAVAKVDAAMCKVRDSGKVKARERIAVLAAINIVFEQNAGIGRPAFEQPSGASTTPGDQAAQTTVAQLLQRIDSALQRDPKLL